jgi:hypothetical protein
MTAARRLAAILAVDVVGYSRLMGGDEAGTGRPTPMPERWTRRRPSWPNPAASIPQSRSNGSRYTRRIFRPCSKVFGRRGCRRNEARAGAMLVACRLAGLSALGAHYAGLKAHTQLGPVVLAAPLFIFLISSVEACSFFHIRQVGQRGTDPARYEGATP